jgi:hypothetical protein
VVDECERAFNYERTVRAAADAEFGHGECGVRNAEWRMRNAEWRTGYTCAS